MRASLIISVQAPAFQATRSADEGAARWSSAQLRWQDMSCVWKHTQNHLRLIIQPCIWSALVSPWVWVFDMPALRVSIQELVRTMQEEHGFLPT